MKKYILLLPVFMLLLSCAKNDQEKFESDIIGSWDFSSFVVTSCNNFADNVPLTTGQNGCVEFWGSLQCMNLQLKEDGTGLMSQSFDNEDRFEQALTYTLNMSENTINLCMEQADCNEFRYEGGRIYNDMDEDGCICTFGFSR